MRRATCACRARHKGMSCVAYRSTNKGALNKVIVVVLLGCVGLTAGLAYGTLFPSHESFSNSCRTGGGPQPWCSPSNLRSAQRLGVTVVMPAKSTYTFPVRFRSAPDEVRLFRGDHPGVREVAHGERVIELTPTGLSPSARWQVCMIARRHCDDYTARWLAMRRTVQWTLLGNGGRPYKVIWHMPLPVGFSSAGTSGQLPIGDYVLFGLLAGLSAALGFLVPPRLRVIAAH
jgi:hypothetical protein